MRRERERERESQEPREQDEPWRCTNNREGNRAKIKIRKVTISREERGGGRLPFDKSRHQLNSGKGGNTWERQLKKRRHPKNNNNATTARSLFVVNGI